MSRLIDADVLIEDLKESLDDCDIQKSLEFLGIYDFIEAQSTAYDIEKVVAELKEWSFKAEIVIPASDGFEDTANREIICTLNAIDIVRKGGAEDAESI